MIKVENNFEAGSIELVEAKDAQNIQLNISKDNAACTRQWFYFSIETDTPKYQKIHLLNAEKVSFPLAWQDYQAFASYDNEQWFRVETSYDSDQLIIEHKAKYKQVFYAYFVPYSLSRQQELRQVVENHPLAEVQSLTKSALGHNIDLITMGEFSSDKKNIWLIARQHPGESMAQWISEGFIKAVLSEQNADLLDEFRFFIISNMNPDGTDIGNHRTNSRGKNLNRCWAEPCLNSCPEVYYVREAMYKHGVDFFIDVHGDESIPYNFIMSKSSDNMGEQFKNALANIDSNFQLQYDYDTFKTSCGISCCSTGCRKPKTATGFIADKFGVPSLLLEASFKELQSTNVDSRWDHHACINLGKNLVATLRNVVNNTEKKQTRLP